MPPDPRSADQLRRIHASAARLDALISDVLTYSRLLRSEIVLQPVNLDDLVRSVIATYPQRAKTRNARRDDRVSLCVLSDDWDGAWVQVDGRAEVLDLPEAEEAFVDYYRCIAGEHPDWDEYRAAMHRQGKSLIRITIERWGPVATGGMPPEVVAFD